MSTLTGVGYTDRRAINAHSEKASRQLLWYLYVNKSLVWSMDQLTIKKPNPKCRLYCCFIEFIDWIDWRYTAQSAFDPSFEL
jgi:hypothetical protein